MGRGQRRRRTPAGARPRGRVPAGGPTGRTHRAPPAAALRHAASPTRVQPAPPWGVCARAHPARAQQPCQPAASAAARVSLGRPQRPDVGTTPLKALCAPNCPPLCRRTPPRSWRPAPPVWSTCNPWRCRAPGSWRGEREGRGGTSGQPPPGAMHPKGPPGSAAQQQPQRAGSARTPTAAAGQQQQQQPAAATHPTLLPPEPTAHLPPHMRVLRDLRIPSTAAGPSPSAAVGRAPGRVSRRRWVHACAAWLYPGKLLSTHAHTHTPSSTPAFWSRTQAAVAHPGWWPGGRTA